VVAGGERFSVATTHLSLDQRAAERQLGAALSALAEWPAPRVLLGDLNLVPDRVARLAQAAGYDLVAGPATVNARAIPDRRLDHVLLDGLTATASGVAKLPLSDHLAVWADLA
jgi:endonuclease/exonuclease/phosphatase family metal-dependent hydrolase